MILVDSSVWIAQLRNVESAAVARLRALYADNQLVIGDLILFELLQGARDETHAARLEARLRQFDVLPMLDDSLAVTAAQNYRRLRSIGVTVRKSIDMLIGTFCIERDLALLQDDRDFLPMARHLGLALV